MFDSDSDDEEFLGFTQEEIDKSAAKAKEVKERTDKLLAQLEAGEIDLDEIEEFDKPGKEIMINRWLS